MKEKEFVIARKKVQETAQWSRDRMISQKVFVFFVFCFLLFLFVFFQTGFWF